jgi:hypothetical protein
VTPYREAPPDEAPKPAQSLECAVGAQKRGLLGGVAAKIVITTVAAIIAQMFHLAAAAVVVLLGFVWIWLDAARNPRIVIRTEGESVHFGLPKPLDIPFAKLLDVRLDTKTATKAVAGARADGLNTIFGPAIPTGRSIQVDQSRIELVVKGRDPIRLSDEWASSTLAHENIRQIKVFLRKAGWLPADERPLEDRPKKKKKKKSDESG